MKPSLIFCWDSERCVAKVSIKNLEDSELLRSRKQRGEEIYTLSPALWQGMLNTRPTDMVNE